MPEVLYLAGPMRGIKEFNFPAFDRATTQLRRAGYLVLSPAELDRSKGFDPTGLDGNTLPESFDLAETMVFDIKLIAEEADGIALLPHWEHSKGANAEVAFANALNIPVKPVGLWMVASELKEVQLVGSS